MATYALNLRQEADENCADGAKYYVCPGNLFTGCCSVNPCSRANCPDLQNSDNEDNDEEKEIDETVTSRLELTISSSINIPVVTTSSTELTETMSTIMTTSESITVSTTATSQALSTSTSFKTDGTVTNTETTEPPISSTTNGTDGGVFIPTDAAEEGTNGGTNGLGVGEIAGICVGIVIIAAAAIIFFVCIRRRRGKVRNAIGFGDPGISSFELQPYRLNSGNPAHRRDPFESFGTGEPEGQFTRASAFKRLPSRRAATTESSLSDQPGEKTSSYHGITAPPPARAVSATGNPPARFSPSPRPAAPNAAPSLGESTRLDWARAGVTTPEIRGSPSLAQVATFRGLPRIVEIPTRREPYRAYYPGALTSSSRNVAAPSIRADLNATEEERSAKQHVTSWAQYENGPHN